MNRKNNDVVGKIFIDGEDVYLVSGYDFFLEKYLAKRSNLKIFYWGSYITVSENMMQRLKTPEDYKTEIEQQINEIKDIVDVYKWIMQRPKSKKFNAHEEHIYMEAKSIFRRIKGSHEYIQSLEYYLKNNQSCEKRAIYERELHRAKKGKRRALKRLHGLLSLTKNGYKIMMDYFEANDFRSPEYMVNKMNKLEKLKQEIDNLEKYKACELDDILQKAIGKENNNE